MRPVSNRERAVQFRPLRSKSEAMDNQTVKITCDTEKSLPLDEILEFQGGLKTLETKEFEKLKQSIIQHGLSFPSFVWQDGKVVQCLDGHQRNRVLQKMREDGWQIPEIPVVYVHAENEEEAKTKILLLSSQYGKYTQESLYEFLNLSDLNWLKLQDILDLPQLDMDTFYKAYFDEAETTGNSFDTEVVAPGIKQMIIQGKAEAFTVNFIDKLHKFLQPHGINIVGGGDDASRPKREGYKYTEERKKRRNEEWSEDDNYKTRSKKG